MKADADVVDDDDRDDTVAKAKCLLTIPVPVVNAKDDDDNGRDTSARSEAEDRNFISRRGARWGLGSWLKSTFDRSDE